MMVERLHPELHVEKLGQIIEPMARLIESLPPLADYSTLLGDDVSARVATLIMRQVINHYRAQQNLPGITTIFIIGGEYLKKQIVEHRQAFFNRHGSSWGKTLYLTEYVESGIGTQQMADDLTSAGVDFDLAALSIATSVHDSSPPIASQIYYGEIGSLGAILHHDVNIAGVTKYDHITSWTMSQKTTWPFGLCARRRQSLRNPYHYTSWTSDELTRWGNQTEVDNRLAHSVIDSDSRYATPEPNEEDNLFIQARRDVSIIANQLISRLSN